MFQANSDVQLFKSEGERNLLFTDSTKCLQENTKPLEEFLGKKYTDMFERTYKTGQGPPGKQCVYDFLQCLVNSRSKKQKRFFGLQNGIHLQCSDLF